ncbi:hypothetical protein SEPCBS57363_001082 [Sporothrix epigloea]|uniref:Aminoglycoside phosphotransferase domain-containing protein n=1 Tax=Sporothrix epigloea TaxID=1892477 RepID=A0ABP0D8C0_9PEZI
MSPSSIVPVGADKDMDSVSPHLQQIIRETEEENKRSPMEDKFCPTFLPSDGPVLAASIYHFVSYYFTKNVFIKRQPHADEMGLDIYGEPIVIPYITDRIRNEAAALRFISEHTTIPVPKLLGSWEENGLVHLKTEMVHGAIALQNVEEARLPAAIQSVTEQLETDILPQLRRLRRNFIGSADPNLPVTVPHNLWGWKDKREWPRVTTEKDDFVFVHTDLGRQNILVDPDTFRIVSIIDWETAGFFPQDWELPKWKFNNHTPEELQLISEAKARQLPLFGADFADEGVENN